MIVELSHLLEPGMPAYPGLPNPQFKIFLAHEDTARQSHYAPGTTFQIAVYEIGGNTGTYVDAPFHRYPDGADLADIELGRVADLPGILVHASDAGAIHTENLASLDVQGKALLVHTGWASRWGSNDYFRSGPFLTRETCEYLVAQRAALVGIDCANIDNMSDPERPAHTILLRAGIPIVEHLRGLEQLHNRSFRFFATPPAVRGGTSFPVRAFAITE